jgi:hypothetical protein
MSSAINSHKQWNKLSPTAQIPKDQFYREYDYLDRNATAPWPIELGWGQIGPCKSNINRYISHNPLISILKKHVKQQTHCLVELGATDL